MKWLKYVLALLTFLLGICLTRILWRPLIAINDVPNNAAINARPAVSPIQAEPASSSERHLEITNVFIDEERLTYNGYVVEKLYKRAQVDGLEVDVSYAVIRRNRRTILKFDEVYSGIGNNTKFGLVSLLGDTVKQLVVSQDVPRGGNQWIVTLGESPRIIYNGTDWGTGRETEDLGLFDLDGDGIFEVSAPVTDFYCLHDQRLSMMNIPLPTIIFRFDSRAQKYLPANRIHSEYIFSRHGQSQVSPPDSPGNHLGDVMKITLDYIFAQREDEGWRFFERECKLLDKVGIRRRMQTILDAQPTYRYLKRKKRLDLSQSPSVKIADLNHPQTSEVAK